MVEHYKNLDLDNIIYTDKNGDKKTEVWIPFMLFEDRYEISTLGRGKSLFFNKLNLQKIFRVNNYVLKNGLINFINDNISKIHLLTYYHI